MFEIYLPQIDIDLNMRDIIYCFPFVVLLSVLTLVSCDENIIDDVDNGDDKEQIWVYPTPNRDTVPAFPGALGGARYITGGAGGTVYVVTSLSDLPFEGTFRYAVTQPGRRTIVFAVAGTIELSSSINITHGDITIAGQTAPGDGITFRNFPIEIRANNVIVRFIRFRMGDTRRVEGDALSAIGRRNIMIDHCSMSWSTDECASFYDNVNFTMQWCVLAESLRNSIHSKGAHGYAGIWGGQMASFHHNLLAHHDSRNPRFCGSRYSNRPNLERVDFRNNVIYNWRANSGYGGEGGSYNMVNNYYKPGPATFARGNNQVTFRIFQPYADGGTNNQPRGVYGRFFVNGNVMANTNPAVPNVTADNWLGMHFSAAAMPEIRAENEFDFFNFPHKTAEQAYEDVLLKGGASLSRDAVDIRIVREVREGIFSFTGSNGSTLGIIDSQVDVGGWPALNFNASLVPLDTDKDGMPDAWEDAHGLNKLEKSDAAHYNLSPSYTNLEVYYNSLVNHLY